MEKCKFCQAELEEMTVCPSCGKDNAEEAVVAEETAVEETAISETEAAAETSGEVADIKPGKKSSPALVAALIIVILALAALMVGLVVSGMKESPIGAPAADQQMADPTVGITDGTTASVPEATSPEGDGDPTSPQCKGTYSAPNDEVLAAKDTVVATAGEFQLTLGELQMYYWQEVSGFLNQYGSYASYYGLDLTQPLDTQMCMVQEGMTWQQYFLFSALNSWHTYQALDAEAELTGYEMPADYAEDLATMPERLDEQATMGGFDSAQSLMTFNVGSGPSIEDYLRFMEIYYHGYNYYNDFYQNVTATPDEIEAMFAEHEEEYAANGLTKETKAVDVRHILIYPEGATSETVRTETFSEEAWAAGKANAQAILDQWLAGDATEESFAALAGEFTQDPGSATTGGLYTDVYEGQMVQNFNDWCFDPARQIGDYGIVETEYGYHIMYYSGEEFLWQQTVEQDVISTKTNDMVNAALEKYPLTVSYDKIMLSLAEAYRVG